MFSHILLEILLMGFCTFLIKIVQNDAQSEDYVFVGVFKSML